MQLVRSWGSLLGGQESSFFQLFNLLLQLLKLLGLTLNDLVLVLKLLVFVFKRLLQLLHRLRLRCRDVIHFLR